jgi:hypothetical protein
MYKETHSRILCFKSETGWEFCWDGKIAVVGPLRSEKANWKKSNEKKNQTKNCSSGGTKKKNCSSGGANKYPAPSPLVRWLTQPSSVDLLPNEQNFDLDKSRPKFHHSSKFAVFSVKFLRNLTMLWWVGENSYESGIRHNSVNFPGGVCDLCL